MRKVLFLLVSTIIVCGNTFAQTNIPGGEVKGTWTKANSPYLIQGAIMIANDSTLTIEPGVKVEFQGSYKFLVLGRLLAVGTTSDTISFTASDTTVGWLGIQFDNTPATNDTSKIIFCKLKYTKNESFNNGGAIYCNNSSKVHISHCRISNNSAYFGGGINCSYSKPSISNNIISNNSASDGGGIYCSYSSPNIYNNIIFNNSTYYGGGIRCSYSSPSIFNNTISNNSASSNGGGFFCSYGSPIIYNNIIAYNLAGDNGGGIWCFGSNPNISNNTIIDNSARKGGALFCRDNSDPTLSNNLLWGNSASISGNQVFLETEDSDPNFYYCNVQGGKSAFGLNNAFYLGTYSNNIDSEPLFVDTTNADYSLQSTSPCINAGDPSGTYPSTDKAGNPRICDGIIDIGAYEYQKSPCNTVGIFNEKSTKQISLFPNPTSGKFQLAIDNIQLVKGELKIYNVFGENVFQSEIFNPINEIDMNGFTDQIYFIRIQINEQVYIKKICKI